MRERRCLRTEEHSLPPLMNSSASALCLSIEDINGAAAGGYRLGYARASNSTGTGNASPWSLTVLALPSAVFRRRPAPLRRREAAFPGNRSGRLTLASFPPAARLRPGAAEADGQRRYSRLARGRHRSLASHIRGRNARAPRPARQRAPLLPLAAAGDVILEKLSPARGNPNAP